MDEDDVAEQPDRRKPGRHGRPAMPRGLVIIGLALLSWLIVGLLLAAILMILN